MQVNWQQLVRLHDKFKSWKPMHLCWWFEQRGLPIPPYLIGGAPNTHQRYFAFGDDSGSADPDNQTWDTENANRIDVVKETPFFLRFAVSEEGGGTEGNKYAELYYNTTNDVSTSIQVTTSSSVVRIVDDPGSNITDGVATDDSSVLTTTGSYANGYYHDASDNSVKHSLDPNTTRDYQFCLQFQSDASNSQIHYFWIRWQTPTSLDNYEAVPTATTETPAVTEYLAGQSDIIISTTCSLSVKKELAGQSNIQISTAAALTISFTSMWETSNISAGSSNSDQVALPLVSGGTYNFTVYWGDGNSDPITAWDNAAKTHTYASEGEYRISILGTCVGWQFNNTLDKLKILDISNWGNFRLGNGIGYFYGCSNLTVTATDILDLTGTTLLSSAFQDCSSMTDLPSGNSWNVSSVLDMDRMFQSSAFNGNITGWTTTALTDMRGMFEECPFNQDISGWDVSNVTDFTDCFWANTAFNQDIDSWTTSSATTMRGMFFGATSFNQNLNSWNVSLVQNMGQMFQSSAMNSNITGWVTSALTDMQQMFRNCPFNQNIGSWDVADVTNFSACFRDNTAFNQAIGSWTTSNMANVGLMFFGATSFNQDISNFDVSGATNLANMFGGGSRLSTVNYNALLIAWDAQVLQASETFDAGNSTYHKGAAATARQSIIDNDLWTINDGGDMSPVGQSNIIISTTCELSVVGTVSIAGQSDVSVSTTASLSVKKELVGQSNVAISTTASLSVTKELVGQSNIVISTTASLSVTKELVGQSNIVISTVGVLSRKKTLQGQSNVGVSTVCSLSRKRDIVGQSNIVISTVGVLQRKRTLVGQSNVIISSTGSLSRKRTIAGQSNIQISTTCDLSITRAISLQGQSDVTISTTCSLSVKKELVGQSNIQISTTCDLSITGVISLQGQSDIVISTTASLSVKKELVGQSDIVVSSTASLSRKRSLSGRSDIVFLREEKVVNGIFAEWVGDNPVGWTVISESPPSREISEVGAGEGHGGSGIGKCNIYTSAGAYVGISNSVSGLIIGRKYRFSVNVDTVTSGAFYVYDDHATDDMFTSRFYTTIGIKTFVFVSLRTSLLLVLSRKANGATDITVDDVSIREMLSAPLSIKRNISSQSNIAISTTASLSVKRSLIGTSAISITTAASLNRQRSLIGASTISVSTTGLLGLRFSLVGQSNIVITSTGTLSVTKQLIGTTNIVTSLTARMIVGWSLSGASAIRISTSAALTDRVKPAWLISRNVAPLNSIMSRI